MGRGRSLSSPLPLPVDGIDELIMGFRRRRKYQPVYLYLWNRIDAAQAGVTLTGDPSLLACWRSTVRVRWG
jgi:hypothetical protein